MKALKAEIRMEITKMFEYVLDMAQVAIPPDNYKVFRSRVLRAGNDCIRHITSFLENYDEE